MSGNRSKSNGDIKRDSPQQLLIEGEDFSTSMARLAELAAKGIVSETKKETANSLEEQALREFLTPKRKVKPENVLSEGYSLKKRNNFYTAVGILVVLLSTGFMAIPKIVATIDGNENKLAPQTKKTAQESAKKDQKMAQYTLADAMGEISKNGELRTSSISELAEQIARINLELASTVNESQVHGNDFSLTTPDDDQSALLTENRAPDTETEQIDNAINNPSEQLEPVSSTPLFSLKNSYADPDKILSGESNDLLFLDIVSQVINPS